MKKVVAIGGGTGLSTLLQGLISFDVDITAIVAVTDNGGSSGRLRVLYDVIPPGDIRNCISALAPRPTAKLLQHRFSGNELDKHAAGNLLLLSAFQQNKTPTIGTKRVCRALGIKHTVLPVSNKKLTLLAKYGKKKITGEVDISKEKETVNRVSLKPENAQTTPEVLKAIKAADIITIGPGSLFTSVIAPLLTPGVREAVKESNAPKHYICNLMTQPNETLNFSAKDHLKALITHTGKNYDFCYVNIGKPPKQISTQYEKEKQSFIKINLKDIYQGTKIIQNNYLDIKGKRIRHNAESLIKDILRNS